MIKTIICKITDQTIRKNSNNNNDDDKQYNLNYHLSIPPEKEEQQYTIICVMFSKIPIPNVNN